MRPGLIVVAGVLSLLGFGCGGEPAGSPSDAALSDAGSRDAQGAPDLGSDVAAEDALPPPVPDAGDAGSGPLDGGIDGGPDGGQDGGLDAGAPSTFRVLTVNLKHPLTGLTEAAERLQIVADGILDRQPDLVALQEVIKDDNAPSFAEQLGALTGYEWLWNFTYAVPFYFDEGIGVLSRWPIVWSDHQDLPHQDLVLFTRQVLGARVAAPQGELQLFCTHMTTDSDDTVKADQALAILGFVRAHPSPLPSFVAGDLNAEPDTLAMRFFRGEASHENEAGNFVDAWAVANPTEDGFTIPSDRPNRRIDYIYAVPGSSGSARPVGCEIMFAQEVNGRYASDHLGVLCDFEL